MKNLLITLVLLVGIMTVSEAESNSHINGYGSFYSHLAPHGVWMEFDDGLVVWRPTIMRKGWAPYSVGRWIWTEYGWYWDSYESFGYITYHYGRWFYDDYYGWLWTPDYDWAPAWVEWRYDDRYVGWAPLPPYAVFSVNFGIHFTFDYVTPYSHWHFVNYNYLCDPFVYKHYVGPKYKYRVFSNTKYRNDYGLTNGRIVNRGIDIGDVRSRSGQDIRQRTVQQVSDPRELTRKDMDRNNDVVRTFVAPREDLRKADVKATDVRKIERRSTLEISKLRIDVGNENRRDAEIRKRNEEKINVDRNQEDRIIINERKKNGSSTIENRNNMNNSRTKTNEVNREGNVQIEKKQTKVKVERKIETPKQENNTVKRKPEQNRNNTRGTDKRVNQERNTSDKTRTR